MLDKLIIEFDKGLRTIATEAKSVRPHPDQSIVEAPLESGQKHLVASLMRVNHCGEVCAQALYNGQSLTSRNPEIVTALKQASQEETEHLAWCEKRINEMGSHKSLLNPLWYAGSFTLGAIAGAAGDKWNLGFLAETERQVGKHLQSHLERLPATDDASRAILEQMKQDEARHARQASAGGGTPLPWPVPRLMRLSATLMKAVAYRI